MTLLIDELYDGVIFENNFRIKKSIQLAHIRPWILKWGVPATGEMVLQILKDDEVLKEVRLTTSEINAALPSTYGHGMLRFDMDPLQLNHDRKLEYTEYTIKLFMDGYITDGSNYYAAIRRYELKIYDTYGDGVISGEPTNDMLDPLGFELYEYK